MDIVFNTSAKTDEEAKAVSPQSSASTVMENVILISLYVELPTPN
jgi:hypothetical protein